MDKIEYKYKGDKEEFSNVGEVRDNYYISHRRPEHFFRVYQGYGISENIVKDLVAKGVEYVLIIYHGIKGVRYLLSKINQWTESEKKYKNKEDDMQVFVSEKDMEQKEI